MDSEMIGIIASDMRQIYMSEMLKKKGYEVYLLDLREGRRISRELLEKENKLWRADALILPIPLRKAGDTDLLSEAIAKHSDRIRKVYGGSFPKDWEKPLEEAGILAVDLMESPEVARKNAIATAEGAIAELMKLMPVNVEGARIVVTGFGTCGKVIAEKLYCLGAMVTVAARSERALTLAGFFGFDVMNLAAGELTLERADGVINTVPARIIGEKEIDGMQRDAALIDIASAPGGCDLAYCERKGIPCKLTPGLPGIYSPKTSAQILLQAMPF